MPTVNVTLGQHYDQSKYKATLKKKAVSKPKRWLPNFSSILYGETLREPGSGQALAVQPRAEKIPG